MAAFDAPRPTIATAGFAHRIGLLLTQTVIDIAAWNDARKTRASLSKLSDHELSDIGLSRWDLDRL